MVLPAGYPRSVGIFTGNCWTKVKDLLFPGAGGAWLQMTSALHQTIKKHLYEVKIYRLLQVKNFSLFFICDATNGTNYNCLNLKIDDVKGVGVFPQKKGTSTDTQILAQLKKCFTYIYILITSFIHDMTDKHSPSKSSRSVSSVPWITPAIRWKICRKNATHAKAKKSGSEKIRATFETLRREIKTDIRKEHQFGW